MKRNLQLILAIVIMAVSSQAQIIITEISYNPPEKGQDSLEYIEFYNASSSDINLEGYYFTEGVVDTFDAVVIEANSYLVTANNAVAFESVFGFSPVEWSNGGLKNGGEDIELRDTNDNVVAFVDFGDADPWPTSADGTDGFGASIELCDLTSDYTQGSNWSVSLSGTGVFTTNDDGTFEIMGSPGAENSAICGTNVLTGDYTVIVNGSPSFTPKDLTINIGETVLWDIQTGDHNVNGSKATYPNNPEGFSSGGVASAPWMFNHKFTIAGVYDYRCDPHVGAGMVGTITVQAEPQAVYPTYSISDVTTENNEGVADSIDVLCTLKGIAYGVNLRPDGLQFTMIDDTGAGIGVYSKEDNFGYSISEGANITAIGKIGQFRGLTQIYLDNISVIVTGTFDLIDPVVVTALDESTESTLVKIENLTLEDPSKWKEPGNSFNVKVTDGSNTYTMRVDRNVTIDKPEGAFNLVGIGGQYDQNAPFDEGYQIFPRYMEDISIIDGLKIVSGDEWFELSPNPVNNSIYIETDQIINSYTIYSVTGNQVQGGNYDSSINVERLQAGLYIIQFINEYQSFAMKFIKK